MYCPECGRILAEIEYKNVNRFVCKASNCRTAISNNKIMKLGVEQYAGLTDYINNTEYNNTDTKYFMLLKEKSDQPLLVKNTNNALEKNKNRLCIVQCNTKEDAKQIFKSMFQYINIDDDNIAEINIIKN